LEALQHELIEFSKQMHHGFEEDIVAIKEHWDRAVTENIQKISGLQNYRSNHAYTD